MTFRPDPTFYPSPRSAMQAPAERHAYVAALNPNGSRRPDEIVVVDLDPPQEPTAKLLAAWLCHSRGTSCIISAGMPVVRLCAPMHRIRMSSAVI